MNHRDSFEFLNSNHTLRDKLVAAHRRLQEQLPFVARIAVTLYDPETGVLKTYVHSSGEDNPLDHYETRLDQAPSLQQILDRGLPRVINHRLTYEDSSNEHTRRLGRQGYAASYTLPVFSHGNLLGFLFFNSYQRDVFDEAALRQLDLYGHLIALMVVEGLATLRTLNAAVKTTGRITHSRDPETGSHLDRMSRYARLIANALADRHDLDDDYIEHVFMFAPLHDIGKIAIPDRILLKPGPLDAEEQVVMRSHTVRGREMIDDLLESFGLGGVQHADVLRNITLSHHEAVDGSGYPEGRHRDSIPLEARIVAVADVFDALTSRRVYKQAWSNAAAFAALHEMAGEKLDEECVAALEAQSDAVRLIQRRFREDPLG